MTILSTGWNPKVWTGEVLRFENLVTSVLPHQAQKLGFSGELPDQGADRPSLFRVTDELTSRSGGADGVLTSKRTANGTFNIARKTGAA
jgi:hypothetical protein